MPSFRYKRDVDPSDSFIEHVLQKPYLRALFSVSVVGFMLLFFANIIVGHLAAAPKSETAISDLTSQTSPDGAVAGVSTEVVPTTSPIINSQADNLAQVAPTDAPRPPKKDHYNVAVFGDSMEDTMGELLEYMDHSLRKKYPHTKFTLYNYGIGSQNVEEGLARFGKPFDYQTRHYPPITSIDADIIVIGSFAYNPMSPYDRNRHWLGLAKLLEEAKKTGADVYLLAEIAPLRADFGKGPNGVNWDTVGRYEQSGKIIEGLQNAVGLAKNENVILINVFEKTITSNRNEGKKEYVNPSDGIHPSVKGHEFTADEIVNSLILY
jgi:hypothetical protein